MIRPYSAWSDELPEYTPAFQVQFINLANNHGWVAADSMDEHTPEYGLSYCLDGEYCPSRIHHCACACWPHRFVTDPEDFV